MRKIDTNTQDLYEERFQDLLEYFNGDDSVLKDRVKFKAWLERTECHIKECDLFTKALQTDEDIGEWIMPTGMMPPEHHGHYECSKCGAWATRPWLKPWKGVVLTEYCPHCGKPMKNIEAE